MVEVLNRRDGWVEPKDYERAVVVEEFEVARRGKQSRAATEPLSKTKLRFVGSPG
jgi:hypothetical protein